MKFLKESNNIINNQSIDKNLNNYIIYYRYDRQQRSYEIWVEDLNNPDNFDLYHTWVGNKYDLNYELSELEKEYKVKAKKY